MTRSQDAVLDKEVGTTVITPVEFYGAIRKEWWDMSTQTSPASTLKQGRHLLETLENASVDELQNLISNGDLLKLMMVADLSKVNRKLFGELVIPPPAIPAGLLTPVSQLVERFMARNELRKWGFGDKDAATIQKRLEGHNHAGAQLPVSFSAWLGKDLRYNWQEMLAWLFDTARELGLNPQDYIGNAALGFYPGSEIRGRRKLSVVGLDFQSFLDQRNGIVPNNARPKRSIWPSLEVPLFLNLNPGYMKAMDGGDTPFLMAAGLVLVSDYVPHFGRRGRRVYADYYWDDYRWHGTAVVAFRELQN